MTKRLFDVAAALLGLALLAPLLLLIALAIKLDSPGPVFFRQVRVGLRGRHFLIFKFRTMAHGARHGLQITVGQDQRITRVGAVLRRYKLDELPQLIDVLRGTMSLVGPRPEVPRYVMHYPPEWKAKVLSVRPGITDRASLLYREESELLARAADPEREYVEVILPDKLRHAVKYADNVSLAHDLRLIGETLTAVFGPRLPASPFTRLMSSPTAWKQVERLMDWLHAHRRVSGVSADALVVTACWFATYLFRLGFERFQPARPAYDNAVLLGVVATYAFSLTAFGTSRSMWRFFGFDDVKRLAMACLGAGLLCAVVIQMAQLLAVPRAVLVLHPVFTLGALCMTRLLYRMLYEHTRQVVDATGADLRRAVVMGGGEVARRLVAGMHQRDGWSITCILDDDESRLGSRIAGVPVTGALEHVLDPEVLEEATHVIVAMSDAVASERERALSLAAQTGLPVLMVPSFADLSASPAATG